MSKRPDTTMKSELLTYISPIFAAGMIALVSTFPTPEAALDTIRERDRITMEIVGGPNGHHPRAQAEQPGRTIIAQTPCFEPGPNLSQRELYACGEFVLDLMRAMDDTRIAAIFDPTDPRFRNPVTNAEYLRMSATRLCRELWLRMDGSRAALDSPVCRETTAYLDSQRISG